MKFIVICVLLFALLTGFCCISACRVSEVIDDTSALLRAAMGLRNKEGAVYLIDAASHKWRENAVFFGTVLRHDEIDNVIVEFARLESYAKTKDEDDFFSNCSALIAQLEHIKEMEWPLFQNIM